MSTALATRFVRAAEDGVRTAAQCLASGGLVAFPTETVYGLGADATDAHAVARLYAAKGRPAFNPLIAHVAQAANAATVAVLGPTAQRLAQAFWPGPLTLVLPKAPGCAVCDLATSGLDSIAVRVPAHPLAQAILAAFGKPVVAPSANLSGRVSPTSAAHVRADLDGRIDLIVDGGVTPVGIESTIVSCLGAPTLLRPGGIAREDIERVLGVRLLAPADAAQAPRAPGMLASHYAPRTRLRLDASDIEAGEALLAFGEGGLTGAQPVAHLNLSPRGDPIEAAANLFGHLRALDAVGAACIAVAPIPAHGLGEAINDRLRRAAA
jgi:L-threonylcarbamoyladenylate synthase